MSVSERAYPPLLVAVGGFVGTFARYATSRAIDGSTAWPLATLVVNIAGAFALGLLIERLASGGAESSRARDVRLLVGTGFLGSFTTYSSFAVETERLLAEGAGGTAVGYVAMTLVVGLLACAAGMAVASWRSRRTLERSRA